MKHHPSKYTENCETLIFWHLDLLKSGIFIPAALQVLLNLVQRNRATAVRIDRRREDGAREQHDSHSSFEVYPMCVAKTEPAALSLTPKYSTA